MGYPAKIMLGKRILLTISIKIAGNNKAVAPNRNRLFDFTNFCIYFSGDFATPTGLGLAALT
jgi:hypothetical protein